ncbi:MBL fold metallo-hydrolase [Acidimicrobiaceae bacterium]|nr:MBL fold metallo-hydrolase [Acidimicrobiaceae bacterium]
MSSSGVTFYGVRGSTPISAPTHVGFGGNTCCAVIDIPDEKPIILDMGSGLFAYSRSLGDCALEATVLLTHLHWDHVAGLPFFSPVLCPGGSLDIYGPPDAGLTLEGAIRTLIRPPFFPVTIDDFAGDLRMHDLWCDELQVSTAKVWARPVPHTSATSGYRVEVGGKTVVYIPDHQQPIDDSTKVADTVLELCDGADLLIHDGQYPQALFDQRAHWGHSTPDYAVEVARQSGVSSLALFSHDPLHTDEQLVGIEQYAQDLGEKAGLSQVFSAREGVRISLAELPV